jgi:hypothetical protein
MLHRNPELSMGTAAECEYQRFEVLEDNVLSLHQAVAFVRT